MKEYTPFSALFFLLVFSGTALTISSTEWIYAWAGLELSTIGMVPLMLAFKSHSKTVLYYFLIQSVGSVFFIAGNLLSVSKTSTFHFSLSLIQQEKFGVLLVMVGLLIKLGMWPFYQWLPKVTEGASWFSMFILLTWQKIAPFTVIINFISSSNLIDTIIPLLAISAACSGLVGGYGGMGETNMRSLIAYSSITHSGWMLIAIILSSKLFIIYFLTYSLISMVLIYSLKYNNLNTIHSVPNNYTFKFVLTSALLTFSGMPPTIGFVIKWMVLNSALKAFYFTPICFLLLGTIMGIFYYLKILSNTIPAMYWSPSNTPLKWALLSTLTFLTACSTILIIFIF
uniref:NADH-ubiquinone oxidoreductase chain 2 n=1 Tax=Patella ferruginea TaxID=87961 RepID=A0A481MVL4_PATFE|nr:NADH dehydrogenase subunit 2 [Patella ferruginea]